MDGGLGHTGRAQLSEFLAQDGHNLLTQHIDLLQNLLEGQACMIHQEELTLLIASVVAEGQGLLNDLLG